jgi:hypothetical protein
MGMTLKEMKINVGKADRLAVLATELGIEPEDGQSEHDVAEAMMAAINSKDDTQWEAMTSDLKEWSNTINAAKKLYKEQLAKTDKKATAATKKATAATKKATPKAAAGASASKAKKAPAPTPAAKKATPKATPKAQTVVEPKKAVPAKPTREELAALKADAKAKVAGGFKKAGPSGMWRDGTPAYQAILVLKDSGKEGITIEKALKIFEARLKKAKLESPNPLARLSIIFRDAVAKRGFATKVDDKFVPTEKLLKVDVAA